MRALAAICLAGCVTVGPALQPGEPSEWKLPPQSEAPKPFGPCLRQLRVRTGRRSSTTYGWARHGGYYATLDSALADRPDLLARTGRAAREEAPVTGLALAGHLGFALAGIGALAVQGFDDRGTSSPAFAALLAISATGFAALVTGWSLRAHSAGLAERAVSAFNRDAEEHGCRDPPLLR